MRACDLIERNRLLNEACENRSRTSKFRLSMKEVGIRWSRKSQAGKLKRSKGDVCKEERSCCHNRKDGLKEIEGGKGLNSRQDVQSKIF